MLYRIVNLSLTFTFSDVCYYKATDERYIKITNRGPYFQASTSSSLTITLHGSEFPLNDNINDDVIGTNDDVISTNDDITSTQSPLTSSLPPTAAYTCPDISLNINIIDPPLTRYNKNTVIVTFTFTHSVEEPRCFLNGKPLIASQFVRFTALRTGIKVEFLCPGEVYTGYLQCGTRVDNLSKPVRLQKGVLPPSCYTSNVTGVTSTSAVIAWPCVDNVTDYVVTIRDSVRGKASKQGYYTSGCYLTLTDLTPSTVYHYYVRAGSTRSGGEPTNVVVVVNSVFSTLGALPDVRGLVVRCDEQRAGVESQGQNTQTQSGEAPGYGCVVGWSKSNLSFVVTVVNTEEGPSQLDTIETQQNTVSVSISKQSLCSTIISVKTCYKGQCQQKGVVVLPVPATVTILSYYNRIKIYFIPGKCVCVCVCVRVCV